MKVVVDATMLDGGPSGAATRLAALGLALRDRGDVDVLHLVRPGVDPLPRLACVPFEGATTPWSRARAGRRLDALLREHGADLFAAGALPLPRVDAAPVALTVHDLRFLDAAAGQGPLRRLWGATSLGRNLKRAARVVAVSGSTRDELVRRGLVDAARVDVVPNAATPGLDRIADVDAIARFRARAHIRTRYILALGPAEPHKHVEDLLEVLALVRAHEDGADLGLVLAGRTDPRYAFALARLADRLGVADAFRLTGVVPDDELAVAMSGADAVVSAARHEGFAIPLVDAQSMGVPVVAVAAGAIPEVCDDAAWLAQPDDLPGLAAAVLDAVTPGDLREARVADGYRKAARWSWERSADALAASWRAALEGAPA